MGGGTDPKKGLTHFDAQGAARMVDVGAKASTQRSATATATVHASRETIEIIRSGRAAKGDVLGVARIAGIMAAKKTHELVPMCHPLMITGADVQFDIGTTSVHIAATVKTTGQTGVEMEALTAVTVAALTIYDMVKAVDRGMRISDVQLEHKAGGASGEWVRSDDPS